MNKKNKYLQIVDWQIYYLNLRPTAKKTFEIEFFVIFKIKNNWKYSSTHLKTYNTNQRKLIEYP